MVRVDWSALKDVIRLTPALQLRAVNLNLPNAMASVSRTACRLQALVSQRLPPPTATWADLGDQCAVVPVGVR